MFGTQQIELLSLSPGVVGLLGIFAGVVLLKSYYTTSNSLPLPPGPPPRPVVGNSFDMPQIRPWVTFKEWSRTYGDVIYLHLPGQPTLVLNTFKSAIDLLERRSGIYSSRPYSVLVDLMTWTFSFGFLPYGQAWRSRRKYFHENFHKGVVERYIPAQTHEVNSFLRRVLASPQNLEKNVRLTFVAVIVSVVYGIQVHDLNAEYVTIAQEALKGIGIAGVPGAFWVEYLPFLRSIPGWVPGATFKRFAEYYKQFVDRMIQQPFAVVKDSLNELDSPPSALKSLLYQIQGKYEDASVYAEQERVVKESMAVAYGASVDTTNSTASCFLLAMAMFPDVQKKAQLELDIHVGPKRLPSIEDHSTLTYIRTIALESLRWQPAVPLALPHMTIAEDEYNGYRIPKGTTVHPNIWAMLRDPVAYPSPEVFNPDRYLKDGIFDPTVQDPTNIAFGFGRRICPGRHLSNNALFLFIASVLHVFNIEPATDNEGNTIPVEVKMVDELVSYPESIPCVLKARSSDAVRLILESS